jgi:predicted nuclease with TOPRIM domain
LSEKIQLENEIQETDYNISVKNTEINLLQGEYDTLSSTLKQLNNQKDVAQKRLDDLDTQVRKKMEFKIAKKQHMHWKI